MLEKLKPLHQLPGVILEWRRITNAMTKVVFPLQREKCWHPKLEMDRIYPVSQSHTATGIKKEGGGVHSHYDSHIHLSHRLKEMNNFLPFCPSVLHVGRVSFTEPNIQNVPKDFEIQMPTLIGESQPSQNNLAIISSKTR